MSSRSSHLRGIDLSGAKKKEEEDSDLTKNEGVNILERSVQTFGDISKRSPKRSTAIYISHDEIEVPKFHDRDFGELNASTCSDLIAGFKASGGQEVPGVVRVHPDSDSDIKYELCAGARRYWVSKYLEMDFLAEVRELNDTEMFEVNEIDNRARKDVTDYERGRRYQYALDQGLYSGQKELAQRLQISESQCSRLISIGNVPPDVAKAFSTMSDLKIAHAKELSPLLRKSKTREAVLNRASNLLERKKAGQSFSGSLVVQYLAGKIDLDEKKKKTKSTVVKSSSGANFATIKQQGKTLSISVSGGKKVDALMKDIEGYLKQLAEKV